VFHLARDFKFYEAILLDASFMYDINKKLIKNLNFQHETHRKTLEFSLQIYHIENENLHFF
jgi:hypothetical protein